MNASTLIDARIAVEIENQVDLIQYSGSLLKNLGAVEDEYTDAMLEREKLFSSYIGYGFALPHGTSDSMRFVRQDGLVFVRPKSPIIWHGETVHAAFALAANGTKHIEMLGMLADSLQAASEREWLLKCDSEADIRGFLSGIAS